MARRSVTPSIWPGVGRERHLVACPGKIRGGSEWSIGLESASFHAVGYGVERGFRFDAGVVEGLDNARSVDDEVDRPAHVDIVEGWGGKVHREVRRLVGLIRFDEHGGL